MYKDQYFESFIELYSIGKLVVFARNNVMEHINTGAIGVWAVSMIGYASYCVGLFTRGWVSIAVMAFGTPLIMGWGIYLSQNPTRSGQRQHIADALVAYLGDNKMNELTSYLSSQYNIESSTMSWRNGIGMFLGILWLGYAVGLIGGRNTDVEFLLSSILLQSAVCLIILAFLISTLSVHRIDRIVMAMKDIKNFDFDSKRFR